MRARPWSRSRLRCLFQHGRCVGPRVLLVLISLCASSSCDRAVDEALVLRFINEGPTEKFRRSDYLDVVPVFNWTFENRDDLAPWQAINLDLQTAFDGDRLRVHFPALADLSQRPNLIRQVDLEASAVDVIFVQLSGSAGECPGGGRVQLYWSAPHKSFSAERSLTSYVVADGGYSTGTCDFPVTENPLWEGRVSFIRIDPAFTPGCRLEVRSVRAVKYRTAEDRLAAALNRARKVTLDGDLRSAFLAPPGHTIERQFEVPRDAIFSFSYGVAGRVTVPVQFSVFLEGGEKRQQLFGADIRPDSLRSDLGWQGAEVDLSGFAGKWVKLTLETKSGASFDPTQSFPAWGNPEVWRRPFDSARPNVILISLDTLRADHLSLYGHDRNTSPNIDRWARQSGVTFENAVAPSPWTLPSHASLFTGLNALHHGVNHDYPVPAQLTLMAELFREASYSTMAVTGGGYVSPAFGFEQGFDKFRTWWMGHDRDRELAAGIDQAIRWISGRERRPFFLFFHTYEIHLPFRARQPFFAHFSGLSDEPRERIELSSVERVAEDGFVVRKRFVKAGRSGAPPDAISAADSALVGQLYDAGIAYTDDHLARLFRALEDLDLQRRTIIVLTSDHGAALGERQLAGHTHLYDFNLMVPLVFALPNGRHAGRRIPEQVSLVDVLPTVLELAGIRSSLSFDGSSLVPLLDGKVGGRREAWSYAALTNIGISLRVSNELKYIYNNTAWAPVNGREELYRLELDREEESNLIASASEVRGLRRRVRQTLESRANGLRIYFTNSDRKPFSGTLKAPFLRPARIKALTLPCRCLSWDSSGTILFEVPPGQTFDVLLEGIGPGSLELKASAEGLHPGLECRIDPKTLDQPLSFAFDGSSWREVNPPSDRPPSTGIVVRWSGDGEVWATADRDAALLGQLGALGYVN